MLYLLGIFSANQFKSYTLEGRLVKVLKANCDSKRAFLFSSWIKSTFQAIDKQYVSLPYSCYLCTTKVESGTISLLDFDYVEFKQQQLGSSIINCELIYVYINQLYYRNWIINGIVIFINLALLIVWLTNYESSSCVEFTYC